MSEAMKERKEKLFARSENGYDGKRSRLEPLREILLGWFYATRNHNLAPRHWRHQTLDELWTEHIAGEDLAEVTTRLLSHTDLGDTSATRSIRDQSAVADLCHIRIEERPYNKAGPQLNVERSSRCIHHRANTHGHLGTLLSRILHHFGKYLVGKVASVGKLEGANTALIARLNHLLGHLRVAIIKYGDNSRCRHLVQNCDFIKSCHNPKILSLHSSTCIASAKSLNLLHRDHIEIAYNSVLQRRSCHRKLQRLTLCSFGEQSVDNTS